MIERADGKPQAEGGRPGGGRVGPNGEARLHAAIAEAERLNVRPEHRSAIGLKATLTDVPVAELARATGAIDVAAAEFKALLAAAERDQRQYERDQAAADARWAHLVDAHRDRFAKLGLGWNVS
jgi:hypothetical protein